MALYVTRPRRDEERIGRGLPSESINDTIFKNYLKEARWGFPKR